MNVTQNKPRPNIGPRTIYDVAYDATIRYLQLYAPTLSVARGVTIASSVACRIQQELKQSGPGQ